MIKTSGLIKVITALLISPIFGMIAGYLLMKFALLLLRGASPGVNRLFKRLQLLTSLALALSQGTNDAQRTIGMIAMGLVATGYLSGFSIPNWVVFLSAAALSLGTAAGGWRIIKTMGTRFYKIRPLHGFSAQAASAAVILGAALLGGPVSTTQVVCSTIMGVGSAERLSKVRWKVARNIFAAWFLTIPLTALLAALIYLIAWIIFPK
jgi:PiT family inorganic phosphate transporter